MSTKHPLFVDDIPINSTVSTKHLLFVDGIPINSTVSTKHPLFVDDIPINATVSTKHLLFVDTVSGHILNTSLRVGCAWIIELRSSMVDFLHIRTVISAIRSAA